MDAVTAPIRDWLRSVRPEREDLRSDIVAGVLERRGRRPRRHGSGVLAGVNPVHGLYASFAGPVAGGLGTSTPPDGHHHDERRARSPPGRGSSGVPAADRPSALVLLTLVAGAFMVVAGAPAARPLHPLRLATR